MPANASAEGETRSSKWHVFGPSPILHARWGGYVREKGLMAMAIFGNVITSLSWFGVNMLGVGLHSYGFMDGAFKVLAGFIASQLVLVGLSLLPRSRRASPRKSGQTSSAGWTRV